MIKLFNRGILLLGSFAIINCSFAQPKTSGKQTAKDAFTKDPSSGVEYHFYKHDKKGKHPALGDFVNVTILIETEGDSVLVDSHKKGGDSTGAVLMPLKKNFNGGLEDGITMMAIGDSAAFKVNMDSVINKNPRMKGQPYRKPPFPFVVYKVKLLKFETEKEMNDEQQKALNEKKVKERESIAKYLKDSNYTATPTSDSLFILKHTVKSSNLQLIQEGDSIFVTYKGTLLNGSVFDQSSNHPTAPFVMVNGQPTLAMVYSKTMPLIRAWVEALGMMHNGDKVTILAPDAIAYGPQGHPPVIPQFAPLVFEMEVLKVVPHK